MELFKKEYLIRINQKQFAIVDKSFLKLLVIDNKNNIDTETIREYLALSEIQEVERFQKNSFSFIKFQSTERAEYFIKSKPKVSNSSIGKIISKLNIKTFKNNEIKSELEK